MDIVYDFSMMQAACTIKLKCNNCKQKSHHVNRPLEHFKIKMNLNIISSYTVYQVTWYTVYDHGFSVTQLMW